MLREHLADAAEWWANRREIEDADGNPKAQRFTADQLIEGGYNLDLCGFPQQTTVVLSPNEPNSTRKSTPRSPKSKRSWW